MDLELLNRFPWDNLCFELIVNYLSADLKTKYEDRQKTKKTALEKYNFYGCSHIFQVRSSWFLYFHFFIIECDGKLTLTNNFFFQVWAIESIPKLGDIIANHVLSGRVPRCLRYKSTSIVTSKSLRLKDILEDP